MEPQAPAEQLSAQETSPTVEPEPALAPPKAPGVTERARFRRMLAWFWCSSEFAALRTKLAQEPEARRRYRLRARAASEFAERACEPQLRDGATNPDAVACELYRQSVYWALLALSGASDPGGRPELSRLLRDAEVRALLGESDAAANPSPVLLLLEREDFVDLSERSAEEQSRLLFALRGTAERLLLLLEEPQSELYTLWLRRLVRVSASALALAAVLFLTFTISDLREQNADIAHGKAWRASSAAVTGCVSPLQFCDENPSFFFHTSEENDPWVELDLETPRDFSAVRIINRKDSYRERASPLVIEVSNDQSHWKQIARREGNFRSWRVDVGKQRARYVRVRLVGFKMLHLAAVRVLP